MLSQKTIDIVKSTAPVLAEHGETLTRHFYERMFSYNPEVLPFFNSANQTGGTQQRALAGAICAYAENIDNLETLSRPVELIANKHVSLRIQPEHYPIVGENLLESIKEVLGDAASDDIINAWGEAYGFLADILIKREAQIYTEQKDASGGWQDFKNFNVVRKEKESEAITSFYLETEDGSKPPSFRAGQYITVRMPSPCGHTTMRNYSLSDQPNQDHFRISVKRENSISGCPIGYVSNMLHDNIDVGQALEIAPPCGEFFLDTEKIHERPLVLLAAGVGVTPILSMLKTALNETPERQITFIYGCLNEKVQAFKDAIDNMADKHPQLTVHYRYSDVENGLKRDGSASTGFIDNDFITQQINDRNSDYYFCGPKPFMRSIYHILSSWSIDPSQIHFEFFGPREELDA